MVGGQSLSQSKLHIGNARTDHTTEADNLKSDRTRKKFIQDSELLVVV